MKSKTIIISNQDGAPNSQRGILTIYEENDLLKCKLRLYNVSRLSASCRLGLYHDNQVYTANLINRGSYYESSFAGSFDMSLDFYSAIIDISNDNQVILEGGTYAGYFYDDNSVFAPQQSQDTDQDIEQIIDNEFDKEEIKIENPTIQDTNACDSCDKCANCKYKEYFYFHQEAEKPYQPALEEPETQPEQDSQKDSPTYSIIDSIIPQFKYIFDNYEPNNELNNLIKNSKFVRVNDGNDEYSIGAIYEDTSLAYICYAVRCNYNTPAPEELGKHHQWLPLDSDDPLSEGYYIVYQDAKDLKIVEV